MGLRTGHKTERPDVPRPSHVHPQAMLAARVHVDLWVRPDGSVDFDTTVRVNQAMTDEQSVTVLVIDHLQESFLAVPEAVKAKEAVDA